MCAPTNTLGFVVAERPPASARSAFGGTADRATRARLTHAVFACAYIDCGITIRVYFSVRPCILECTHVRIHAVSA